MSGHSKWSTIKHKKGKTDAQRAKIFTKIGREITVCVKESGADINTNNKLRDLIAKAKQNNVPNDNIERVIKKASGGGEKANYETVIYEGYGPCGVAMIIECLTDNRNRTAADIRHSLDKFGGNLGTMGCVSFMFEKKGVIVIESRFHLEEQVIEDFLKLDIEDFLYNNDVIMVYTTVLSFGDVKSSLKDMGYSLLQAEIEQVASTYTKINDEESLLKMNRLLEMLEDNDDVQSIFHNLED